MAYGFYFFLFLLISYTIISICSERRSAPKFTEVILNFNWCYTLFIHIELLNVMCMFFFECPLAICHWPFNWLYLNRMFAFILSIISIYFDELFFPFDFLSLCFRIVLRFGRWMSSGFWPLQHLRKPQRKPNAAPKTNEGMWQKRQSNRLCRPPKTITMAKASEAIKLIVSNLKTLIWEWSKSFCQQHQTIYYYLLRTEQPPPNLEQLSSRRIWLTEGEK